MSIHPWQPAAPPIPSIARPRIDAIFAQALTRPVTVVVAASGFGKTLAAMAMWDDVVGNKAWWTMPGSAWQADFFAAAAIAWGLPAWSGPGSESGSEPKRDIEHLCATLINAPGGVLLIDDLSLSLTPELAACLNKVVSRCPAQCRLVLLCRTLPPLTLAVWRSQHKLVLIDQATLALTQEEWQAAGLRGGAEACDASLGWWAAGLAANLNAPSVSSKNQDDISTWNADLAAWLNDAWYADLSSETKYLVGVLSLLPTLDFADFCALSQPSGPLAQTQWDALAALTGPLLVIGDTLMLAPHYRHYVTQAWRRDDMAAWTQRVSYAVRYFIEQARDQQATQLAMESGLPELQEQVLQALGWRMLFTVDRDTLGSLLRQRHFETSNDNGNSSLLQLAWQIEVERNPHLADADLSEKIPHLTGHAKAAALALSASIGWQYDDHDRAERDADLALESFPTDLHPAYSLALLLLGSVYIIQGKLHAAEPLLRKAQAYAARDGLPYLQLEILQRRALLACESGDTHAALQCAQEVHTIATQCGLHAAGIRDSTSRLIAWIKLQNLECEAVHQALEIGRVASDRLGERWHFPRRWFRCALALAADDMATARVDLAWMEQQLSQQFYPQKWQNETVIVQLWRASRSRDWASLLTIERSLRQCDWQDNVHTNRRRVLLAATRLLAEIADDQRALQSLHQKLTEQGAHALAHQLDLILILQNVPFDKNALLRHVRHSAAQKLGFDYLWLGKKTVAPLEKLISATELAHDETSLQFLRRIVHHLLTPMANSATTIAKQSIPDCNPPAGLTSKEWQVLQLIGQQHTNEQIAARMFVSIATIKTHINHLYAKLNIKTRAEAMHAARSM